MRRKGYQAILWFTLLGLLTAACTDKKEERKGGEAEYKTLKVTQSNHLLHSDYTARLTGQQIVEIRPQVSGNITSIRIREGDRVTKGQTLFVIDQVPYEAALRVATAKVESAQAKLETARLNYQSEKQLKEQGVVSDFNLSTATNALHEAEAALTLAKAEEVAARNNLSYTVVKSPVSGAASMIPYHVGALVGSNIAEPLVTVADDSRIYAYFSITENQSLDLIGHYGSIDEFLRKAPEVELRMSNRQMFSQKGRIDAVSGTVDSQTGAVSVRAVFPNPQHLLHNGGSATVVFPTEMRDVIIIPQEATYELQNRLFVYRVIDGKTKATPIEVHPTNNGQEYIVSNGLSAGDVIIAEGAGLLRDGVEVK
ncbi:MAG: efflux RND transporter periplasmic adaptor subunit [Bacteroidaceae bacterium]|nr:efflux RND transporter periplasmic adaptor subunit [Bacteroidaceae bacterium]